MIEGYKQSELEDNYYSNTLDSKIRLLIEQGVVSRMIGELPANPSLAMVLWAHNPPGVGFEAHIELSDCLSGKKPYIVVDDIFPKAYFKRTSQEQMDINEAYSNFFLSRECTLTFSSEIYSKKSLNKSLLSILGIAERLSLTEFLRALPEDRMKNFSSLKTIELLHILNELYLLELTKEKANLLIVPHFSQAIAVIHRNISQKPMSVIVTPIFGRKIEISERISKIKSIAQLQDYEK